MRYLELVAVLGVVIVVIIVVVVVVVVEDGNFSKLSSLVASGFSAMVGQKFDNVIVA